jgi:hypothetical protein
LNIHDLFHQGEKNAASQVRVHGVALLTRGSGSSSLQQGRETTTGWFFFFECEESKAGQRERV